MDRKPAIRPAYPLVTILTIVVAPRRPVSGYTGMTGVDRRRSAPRAPSGGIQARERDHDREPGPPRRRSAGPSVTFPARLAPGLHRHHAALAVAVISIQNTR